MALKTGVLDAGTESVLFPVQCFLTHSITWSDDGMDTVNIE